MRQVGWSVGHPTHELKILVLAGAQYWSLLLQVARVLKRSVLLSIKMVSSLVLMGLTMPSENPTLFRTV
jgi:hypothetical protein